MVTASVLFGIFSIIFSLALFGYQWIGTLLGIIGIILGCMAKKRDPLCATMAITGIVLSSIGMFIGIITYSACVACKSCVKGLVGLFK